MELECPVTLVSQELPKDMGDDVTLGFAKINVENNFMKTGEQKHLLILKPIENGYASPSYLTNKAVAQILANMQYRTHQLEMENTTDGLDVEVPDRWKTPQKFVPFKNIKSFKQNDIMEVKWASSYVKNYIDLEKLSDVWARLFSKPQQEYNPQGITKDRVLEMCQAYDFILHKKYPHPMTYDQMLAMEKNKNYNKSSKESNNNNNKPDDVENQ